MELAGDLKLNCAPFPLPQVVAGLVGAAEQNVDVFSVQLKQERPPIIDVRYSAHGSPYFKAVMLDGILLSNRQKVRRRALPAFVKPKRRSAGCVNINGPMKHILSLIQPPILRGIYSLLSTATVKFYCCETKTRAAHQSSTTSLTLVI